MNARILVVEDNPICIRLASTILKPIADHITSVRTLADACRQLQRNYFNVALVDLNLGPAKEQENQDFSFLKAICEMDLAETVRTIIWSGNADPDVMRQAFVNYQVVDFLSKSAQVANDLIVSVKRALASNHLDEEIELDLGGNDLASLWQGMQWAEREDPEQLLPEMRDLLRRLFPDATGLFIQRLTAGQSGAGVLQVEPYYGSRTGESVIVKYGKRDKIKQESTNYKHHAEGFVGAYSSTRLNYAGGRVMGALAYSLIGTELGAINNFGQFYAKHEAPAVNLILDHLFRDTCGRWYDDREQPRRKRDLVQLYTDSLHIQWEEVWAGAAAIGIDMSKEHISLPGFQSDLINPQDWLAKRGNHLFWPIWCAITHGDFNEFNILVTEDLHCWLIDFYRTGFAHILRDVVELETTIKFNLTETTNLSEHCKLEKFLLGQNRIDQPQEPTQEHLHYKPLVVIEHLRSLTQSFTSTRDNQMVEYNLGLLLTTLNLLRFSFMRQHHLKALLSAGLLCEWLDDKIPPSLQ